jgi:hypothetical protein
MITHITELHHVNSLERAAYTTLFLLQELQSSSSQVSAMASFSLKTGSKSQGPDYGVRVALKIN